MTVSALLSVSLFINGWTLFVFRLKNQDNVVYCDVKSELSQEYFQITLIYVSLVILLPIGVLFICNSIITYKITKYSARSIQKEDQNSKFLINPDTNNEVTALPKNTNNNNKPTGSVKQVVKDLFIISVFYSLFNLFYLISWLYFYYNEFYTAAPDETNQNIAYAYLKLSEIFYLINFVTNFYIYVISNPQFRMQLKKKSNFIFILIETN
jgi:hypothetical protein